MHSVLTYACTYSHNPVNTLHCGKGLLFKIMLTKVTSHQVL